MFTVLPFGLSSAPYIFTKVVCVLVRYWRSYAVRITVYLVDGLGSTLDFACCEAASVFVKNSLQHLRFPMIVNQFGNRLLV